MFIITRPIRHSLLWAAFIMPEHKVDGMLASAYNLHCRRAIRRKLYQFLLRARSICPVFAPCRATCSAHASQRTNSATTNTAKALTKRVFHTGPSRMKDIPGTTDAAMRHQHIVLHFGQIIRDDELESRRGEDYGQHPPWRLANPGQR